MCIQDTERQGSQIRILDLGRICRPIKNYQTVESEAREVVTSFTN